jgi:mlo protein
MVTPTWAVVSVCFIILAISIALERLIHLLAKWLLKKHKRALYEALEKVKAELMLVGFISLLLTVLEDPITSICVPKSVSNSWHPCNRYDRRSYVDRCEPRDMAQFVSAYGLHQLHVFIFVLAVFHVLFSIITLTLGRLKMRKWKVWEDETKTIEYQYYNDPERFRFARETSFVRRHLTVGSDSPILLWIVCFFRQFYSSVAKVDYLTLRHGFITAHFAPQSQNFDFQKYIKKSLDEDFKTVVEISPVIWLFALLYLLSNTQGWVAYLWLPFIPLIVILLVGAKLQVIITQMGLRVRDVGDVVRGAPVVQPGDELFWFGRPRLMLFLINLVLFQNAFQLAFFMWSWYEFGLRTCFHEETSEIVIRVTTGVIVQFLCSYVTLPLYALVTQMGTSMKPTVFSENVAAALKTWHHTAKEHTKHGAHSGSNSPYASMPVTPRHGNSPVHLLHNYPHSSTNSLHNSPIRSNIVDNENWGNAADWQRRHQEFEDTPISTAVLQNEQHEVEIQQSGPSGAALVQPVHPSDGSQHEVQLSLTDFSFNKKR